MISLDKSPSDWALGLDHTLDRGNSDHEENRLIGEERIRQNAENLQHLEALVEKAIDLGTVFDNTLLQGLPLSISRVIFTGPDNVVACCRPSSGFDTLVFTSLSGANVRDTKIVPLRQPVNDFKLISDKQLVLASGSSLMLTPTDVRGTLTEEQMMTTVATLTGTVLELAVDRQGQHRVACRDSTHRVSLAEVRTDGGMATVNTVYDSPSRNLVSSVKFCPYVSSGETVVSWTTKDKIMFRDMRINGGVCASEADCPEGVRTHAWGDEYSALLAGAGGTCGLFDMRTMMCSPSIQDPLLSSVTDVHIVAGGTSGSNGLHQGSTNVHHRCWRAVFFGQPGVTVWDIGREARRTWVNMRQQKIWSGMQMQQQQVEVEVEGSSESERLAQAQGEGGVMPVYDLSRSAGGVPPSLPVVVGDVYYDCHSSALRIVCSSSSEPSLLHVLAPLPH